MVISTFLYGNEANTKRSKKVQSIEMILLIIAKGWTILGKTKNEEVKKEFKILSITNKIIELKRIMERTFTKNGRKQIPKGNIRLHEKNSNLNRYSNLRPPDL